MNDSFCSNRRRLALAAAAVLLPVLAAAQAAPIPLVGVPDFARITRTYGPAVVNISVSGMRTVSAGNDDEEDGDALSRGAL